MPIHDDVCRMRFITSHAKQCITYGHCVRKALHNRIRTHTCAVEHVFLVTVRVSAKRFKISKWNLLPFIYPPFVRVPQRFFLFIRWNRQFNLSQAILSGFEFVPICLYQLIIIDCLLIIFLNVLILFLCLLYIHVFAYLRLAKLRAIYEQSECPQKSVFFYLELKKTINKTNLLRNKLLFVYCAQWIPVFFLIVDRTPDMWWWRLLI